MRITFIVLMSILTISFFVLFFINNCPKQQHSDIDILFDDGGRISIPVLFNGSKMWWLWDTGASISAVNEDQVTVDMIDSVSVSLASSLYNIMPITDYMQLSIGDFRIKANFIALDSTRTNIKKL